MLTATLILSIALGYGGLQYLPNIFKLLPLPQKSAAQRCPSPAADSFYLKPIIFRRSGAWALLDWYCLLQSFMSIARSQKANDDDELN